MQRQDDYQITRDDMLLFIARLLVIATRLVIIVAARLFVRTALLMLLLARRLHDDDIVVLVAVDIVTVTLAAFAEFAAIVALEAFLHLRLCGGNDAVVVFGVLQVVLGDNAVAGALRVTSELRVFLGDVLGSATDLYVWAGAVVAPRQRIATLAVEIVVIVISTAAAAVIVVATPATALVLLSWPHRSFT